MRGGAIGCCTPSRWSAAACCWRTSPWSWRWKGAKAMGAIKGLRVVLARAAVPGAGGQPLADGAAAGVPPRGAGRGRAYLGAGGRGRPCPRPWSRAAWRWPSPGRTTSWATWCCAARALPAWWAAWRGTSSPGATPKGRKRKPSFPRRTSRERSSPPCPAGARCGVSSAACGARRWCWLWGCCCWRCQACSAWGGSRRTPGPGAARQIQAPPLGFG